MTGQRDGEFDVLDIAPFPTLAALHAAHDDMRRRQTTAPDSGFYVAIDQFMRRVRATGTLLTDEAERADAQHVLAHWALLLAEAGYDPPDTSLAEPDEPAIALPDHLCPYLGLDAFHEDDRTRFFGRERLISELLERMRSVRLLAVIGPSGSGKSSVVHAGLIPALKSGALSDSASWRYFPRIVPGSEPLTNLARLATVDPHEPPAPDDRPLTPAGDPARLVVQVRAERLAADARHLAELVNAEPALLVIDQFEELFTLCDDEQRRRAFIENLLHLVTVPDTAHRVVLTMRSDFETFVARYPALQQHFEAGRVPVTPLNAAELRAAITAPAEAIGLRFEAGVVNALLHDLLGEPAGLPLLQFTLLQLWEARVLNQVTADAYQRLGGGRLALARCADACYGSLIPEEQITARRILLRMVRPGDGLEVTSHRVRQTAFYAAGEDPQRIDRVLGKLIAARLVRRTAGQAPGDVQVEIAHEALVRNWPTLVGWLEEEKVALATRRRLELRASEWVRLGRGEGGRLDEVELREAERWLAGPEAAYLGYDPALPALVAASQAALTEREHERESQRRRELEQAQALAEAKTRAARRLRRLSFALVIALVLTLASTAIAATLAGNALETVAIRSTAMAQAEAARREEQQQRQTAVAAQQQEQQQRQTAVAAQQQEQQQRQTAVAASILAEEQRTVAVAAQQTAVIGRQEAEQQRLRARSGELAAQAQAALEGQPQLGLLLAVEAFQVPVLAGEPPAPVARETLHNAVTTTSGSGLSGHQAPIRTAALSSDGALALTAGDDAVARLWSLTDPGRAPRELAGHDETIRAVAISPDGQKALTAGDDATARLWNLADPAASPAVLRGHDGAVTAVQFSPDGRWVITAGIDATARLWSTDRPGAGPIVLRGHSGPITAIAVSSNGQWLALGSSDEDTSLWSLRSATLGDFYGRMFGRGAVTALAFSADTRQLAIGFDSRRIEVWSLRSSGAGGTPAVLIGHQAPLTALAFSPDGQWLASAAADRTVRLWAARGLVGTVTRATVLSGHTEAITALAISPDSRWLASAAADRTVRLWNLNAANPADSIQVLRGHEGPIRALVISADGSRLLSGGDDTSARSWVLPLPDRTAMLGTNVDKWLSLACQTAGRNLTRTEWERFFPAEAYRATCADLP